MDTMLGYEIAAISFLLFVLLGAFDGVYFHMIKYKLYQHPPARFEHQLHTFRGIIFLPITLIFFVWNSAGMLLWLGLFFLLVDFIAEIIDILVEKEARKDLGGISPFESVIHVTATGFRMASLGIILSLKPTEAYSWSALTCDFTALPSYLQYLGSAFAIGLGLALLGQTIFSLLPFFGKLVQQSSCFLRKTSS